MKVPSLRLTCFALVFAILLSGGLQVPVAAAHRIQDTGQQPLAHAPASKMANPSPLTQAAGQVEFSRNTAELNFPNNLTFSLAAKADEKIESVALEYGTNAASCVRSVARQPVEIEPGTDIKAEWVWDFKDSGSLPMGAQVWWEWEAKLASGEVARSPRQTQTIVDQHFSWKETGSDPAEITSINIWYHDTKESFAKDLATIGQKALQRMQTEFSVTPATQVQFILYNNSTEVFESGLFFSEWIGGYAVPVYNLVIIGVEVDNYDWGKSVITHELGHLISGELTANCLAVSMPTWLSEGFAMYAEGGVAPSEQDKVKKALTAGTLPPLRTLAAGFAANDADARLSYAQSGMVVDFMVKEYGADKLPQLFATIQAGTLAEDGLRQVYNLEVDALDNA